MFLVRKEVGYLTRHLPSSVCPVLQSSCDVAAAPSPPLQRCPIYSWPSVLVLLRACLSCRVRVFKFVKQWKDTLVVRFKILVAHFQIVTTFPSVLDVQWPEAFNR